MIAFWRYDLFPYCLSGKVVDKDSDGRVQVVGYADMLFTPMLITSDRRGKRLQDKIGVIQKNYQDELERVHREYRSKLKIAAPFLFRETMKESSKGETE